jgi:hypothetical protein
VAEEGGPPIVMRVPVPHGGQGGRGCALTTRPQSLKVTTGAALSETACVHCQRVSTPNSTSPRGR